MPVRRGVAGPGTMVVVIAALVLSHFAAPASAVSAAARSSLSAVPDTHSASGIQRRRLINHLLDLADTAAARGDRRAADSWRRAARRLECRFFGRPPPTGKLTISMDPTTRAGFMSMPWPADTRRNADGTIDLTGFPGRDVSSVLDLILGRGAAATHGFGTNSAVYLQTTGPLDPKSLPTADQSVGSRSNALLLDLDDRDAAPVPLLSDFKQPAAHLRPPNLLTLLPYPGHPLTPGHRYAAMVFDGLLDATGSRLAPSPLLHQLDGAVPVGVPAGTWAQLREEHELATRAVRARTLWHPSELVAFTVFTTQRVTPAMDAIAAAVRTLQPPLPVDRTAGSCSSGAVQAVSSGQLDLPKWQAGTAPYLNAGGDIVIGPGGRAVRQGVERVGFEMAWPCARPPARGWPILLFMDGTGACPNASNIGQLAPSESLPYVILSIASLYSCDRSVASPLPFDLLFYNYLNPRAAATNQLQQAADMLYLKRVAQNMRFAATEGAAGRPPTVDTRTVVISGHSQGAYTLPITLAADPSIRGAFESAGGSSIYNPIVHRGDIRSFLASLIPTDPGEIDKFHPDIQAFQTFFEIGEPSNYAPLVRSADVVLYAGWLDDCVPIEANVTLANAFGVQVAHPIGGPVFGSTRFEPALIALPASRNLRGRTGVMVEVNSDHGGAVSNPRIGRSFLLSIAGGGPAVVDPGALTQGFQFPSCQGRAPDPGLGG